MRENAVLTRVMVFLADGSGGLPRTINDKICHYWKQRDKKHMFLFDTALFGILEFAPA
jgi:hypothetical protein